MSHGSEVHLVETDAINVIRGLSSEKCFEDAGLVLEDVKRLVYNDVGEYVL